jgi:hypothetical protein
MVRLVNMMEGNMRRFVRSQNFSAVSLHDVLEAREHYAVHLANLPNVVGTAVGRYRQRLKDKRSQKEIARGGAVKLGPKTLANSRMKDWSWPCVLVLVNQWVEPDIFAKHPERAVPPQLYLPDGRIIKTCVVLVEVRHDNLPAQKIVANPSSVLGAGSQIFAEAQDYVRLGITTCLVSDGGITYALTSGHVLRPSGSKPSAQVRGRVKPIGVSDRVVEEASLEDTYPGLAGKRTFLTLDAGLIRLESLREWTSQFAGIGTMGPPVDLSAETLNLDMIGCPLVTVLPGGIRATGTVHGLFYRHASMSGVNLVTELLIGPRDGEKLETRPGDSGLLWFWDHVADERADNEEMPKDNSKQYSPIAMQWGGHGFQLGDGTTMEFALASGLTTVCRQLGVQIVRDWDSFQSRYWGKVGHYKVAAAACTLLQSNKAKSLFEANLQRIGVSDDEISGGDLPMKSDNFIPLADVADLYFRAKRKKDDANHFADMDEPAPKGMYKGKTLLELWKRDPSSRTTQAWTTFYDAFEPKRSDKHRGALPFRIKQLYELMVEYVKKGKVPEYVCVAGLLAHYAGDACQPLHVSYLHHGEPGDTEDDDVHAVYEDKMLTKFAPDVIAGVNAAAKQVKKSELFEGGEAAADTIIQLMQRTVKRLPPERVVSVYKSTRGNLQEMWNELDDKTISRLADGAHTLALIWQSAWTEGGGDRAGQIAVRRLVTIPEAALRKLYEKKEFAESHWLREM